jgi:hypothetical protein
VRSVKLDPGGLDFVGCRCWSGLLFDVVNGCHDVDRDDLFFGSQGPLMGLDNGGYREGCSLITRGVGLGEYCPGPVDNGDLVDVWRLGQIVMVCGSAATDAS